MAGQLRKQPLGGEPGSHLNRRPCDLAAWQDNLLHCEQIDDVTRFPPTDGRHQFAHRAQGETKITFGDTLVSQNLSGRNVNLWNHLRF